MSILQDIAEKLKSHPTDVSGIDFGTSGTKVVRLRKNGEELALLGVDLLPPVDLKQRDQLPRALDIPAKLKANYAAICINSEATSLKLLTIPGAIDAAFESNLARNLGLPEDTDDRLGYRVISEGAGRTESRILAVGLPEPESSNCMALFATGLPAPWRLEASSIATLTTFQTGPIQTADANAIGLLNFSSRFCSFSIFFKKTLVLFRRFDFGLEKVLSKITTSLNVDHSTAASILADGAFDISDLLHDIMQPLLSQLVVSRDFIERRENCSINTLYLTGNFSESDLAIQQIQQALNLTVAPWDPFDLPNLSLTADIPEKYDKQRWRFAAALGVAIAAFEEES